VLDLENCAYLWKNPGYAPDNPVLYPAFFVVKSHADRVLAKAAEVKNNFINAKKKFNTQLPFSWNRIGSKYIA